MDKTGLTRTDELVRRAVSGDGSACLWDDVTRNGAGVEVSRTKNRIFANLTIMPTVRFDWFTVPVAENMSIGMYTGHGERDQETG